MEFEHSSTSIPTRKSCSRRSKGDRWQPVPLLEELINGGDGDRTAEHGEG